MKHSLDALVTLQQGNDFFWLPLGGVLIFLLVISICVLLGRYKAGVLLTYCCVFYLGFVSNRDRFVDLLSNTGGGMMVYIMTAVMMVVVFTIGFFLPHKD
jgi:O-antigen ligase